MDDIGYEFERFPGDSFNQTNQFFCNICTLVSRSPRECSACGSIFCGICIEQWMMASKECPKKKCDLVKNPVKKISGALLMLYNNLDIKCKYSNCLAIKKLCEIESHEAYCQTAKCINYELCGNGIKPEFKDSMVCDYSCLLLSKIKANYPDWMKVHKEIRSFLKNNLPDLQKVHLAKNSWGNVTAGGGDMMSEGMGNYSRDSTLFKWDRTNASPNIEFSENDTKVFLKESAYMFRTVIGNRGFVEGVIYWEIIADSRSENELKIGVTKNREFNYNSAFCDYDFGYAYYGVGQLRQNSNSVGANYGKKFKESGVLGVCLNMDKGTLSFALDGDYWGVAFQNENLKRGPIYPAISLLHFAGCKVVSGKPAPSYFLN